MFSDLDKRIIYHLLKMASEKFGHHGCNDLDLTKLIPNADDRRALIKEMQTANGTPEEFDPETDYKYTADWWLMSHMANKVKNS